MLIGQRISDTTLNDPDDWQHPSSQMMNEVGNKLRELAPPPLHWLASQSAITWRRFTSSPLDYKFPSEALMIFIFADITCPLSHYANMPRCKNMIIGNWQPKRVYCSTKYVGVYCLTRSCLALSCKFLRIRQFILILRYQYEEFRYMMAINTTQIFLSNNHGY